MGSAYNINSIRNISSDRKSTINKWVNRADKTFNDISSQTVTGADKEETRYYRISTTIEDIIDELGLDRESEFFPRGRITGNSTYLEKIRSYYNIANGVEGHTYGGDEEINKGLKLKAVRYTENGATRYYDQNDLNPSSNPTVQILSKEDFERETTEISTSQRQAGINNNNYEIWTEYVFHVENYPIINFGETLDARTVPGVTTSEFMAAIGVTSTTPLSADTRRTIGGSGKKIVKYGMQKGNKFYNIENRDLNDAMAAKRTHTAEMAEVNERHQTRVDLTIRLLQEKAKPRGERDANLIRLIKNTLNHPDQGLAVGLYADSPFNLARERTAVNSKYNSKIRAIQIRAGFNDSVMNKIKFDANDAIVRNVAYTRERYKVTFSISGASGDFSEAFIQFLAGAFPKNINTRDFFAQEEIDFRDPHENLDVAYPLSRLEKATGYRGNIKQRRWLYAPIKVLLRRIDSMSGTTILDTQNFINYSIPEVLTGLKKKDYNRKEEVRSNIRRLLKKAFDQIASQFKSDFEDGKILFMDQLFTDIYGRNRHSNRTNYRPAYFTLTKLYGLAAKIETEENDFDFDPLRAGFHMSRLLFSESETHPNYAKYYDNLFMENPGLLMKSPKKLSADRISYYDTDISLKEINKYFHPKFILQTGAQGSNVSLAKVNINTTDVHKYARFQPNKTSFQITKITKNMVQFVMNYLSDYVDRSTIDGIYGRTSHDRWVDYQISNWTRSANPSPRVNDMKTAVRNAGMQGFIDDAIEEDGFEDDKFHVKQDYANISMVYADGNSGIVHQFIGSEDDAKVRAAESQSYTFGDRRDAQFVAFKVKQIPAINPNRYRYMLHTVNSSLGWAINHAKIFRVHVMVQNAIQYRQIFSVRAIDNILSPANINVGLREVFRASFFKSIMDSLRMGIRFVGVFNEEESKKVQNFMGYSYPSENSVDTVLGSFQNVVAEQKTYFMKYLNSENEVVERFAIPFAEYDEVVDIECIDMRDVGLLI